MRRRRPSARPPSSRRHRICATASCELAERERSAAVVSDLAPPAAPEPEAATHLLYVARDGWQLVERDGPVPPLDAAVEVDGVALVVTRVGRSPLPGDPRACAYLEPARGAA